MLRKSRIDAPGALHHIIVRGIDRQKIFENDEDRDHFLSRLGIILTETKTDCYAWALIPNHFHLLLRMASAQLFVELYGGRHGEKGAGGVDVNVC